jgi:hypothetical protein
MSTLSCIVWFSCYNNPPSYNVTTSAMKKVT